MDSDRSPIIPRQFVPVLEYAAENDPKKAAFLIRAIISAWQGDEEPLDVPPEYADAWLALQDAQERMKGAHPRWH